MLLPIGDIVKGVTDIVDDLVTTKEEIRQLDIKEQKIEADIMMAQMEVNKAEAQHKSMFVAGWRPFIGWIGGIALAYQFIIYPILTWIWFWMMSKGNIPEGMKPPPVLDTGALFAVITGMLGIGAMRSYDKVKGVDTKNIPSTRKEFRLRKKLEKMKSKGV
jgi:hypothetical protein